MHIYIYANPMRNLKPYVRERNKIGKEFSFIRETVTIIIHMYVYVRLKVPLAGKKVYAQFVRATPR